METMKQYGSKTIWPNPNVSFDEYVNMQMQFTMSQVEKTKQMFEESEIMQSILISLHNMNVLGLPLHDAVICQKKDANTVSEVMLTEYIKATGFSIPIEVK